jgi:hypothetical protein
LAAPGPDFVETIPLKLSNMEKCLIIGQGIKRYAAEQTAGLLMRKVINSKPTERPPNQEVGRIKKSNLFYGLNCESAALFHSRSPSTLSASL